MTLDEFRAQMQRCPRCVSVRAGVASRIVFGEGDVHAKLLLVGEAPGATEAMTGIPFSGVAGGLLTKMLLAEGIRRESVFITNTVQCRPPENRDPTPEELKSCCPNLFMKISLVRPRILVALGRVSAQVLTGSKQPIKNLRGVLHSFQGIPVIVTYHPASLMYDSVRKKDAWEDFRMIAEQLAVISAQTC
jgi:uracil-DNA glycosylase